MDRRHFLQLQQVLFSFLECAPSKEASANTNKCTLDQPIQISLQQIRILRTQKLLQINFFKRVNN